MRVPATEARPGRLRELDVLRGIAIGAVVMIHVAWDYAVAAGMTRTAGRAAVAMHLLAGFAVPLFLALSVAGLNVGYGTRMSLRAYLAFLRDRALRLLPAYLFWSCVSLVVFKPSLLASPVNAMRVVLRGDADGHLYYIPLVFELYILWPLFQPLLRLSARSYAGGLAIAAGGLAFSLWWWQFAAFRPPFRGTEFLIFVWLLYVGFGIAIAPRLEQLRPLAARASVLMGLTAITSATAYFAYETFIAYGELCSFQPPGVFWAAMIFRLPASAYVACAIPMTILLVFRYGALGQFFLPLGNHTYGIFLLHLLVLRLVVHRMIPPAAVAMNTTAFTVAVVLSAWLACIGLSLGLVAVASRFTATRWLVSHRW
jgi:peptidoglycan/LPS O-acetylase OafA/YrhL